MNDDKVTYLPDDEDKADFTESMHTDHDHQDCLLEHSVEACALQHGNRKNLIAIEDIVFPATAKILQFATADNYDDRRFLAMCGLRDIYDQLRLLADETKKIAAELADDGLTPERLEALRNHNEVNSKSWQFLMRGSMHHKEIAPELWRDFAAIRYKAKHPRDYFTGEVKEEDWLEYLLPRK